MSTKRHHADDRSDNDLPPVGDPLLAALAVAEQDDEPVTDDDRAAAEAGWEAYVRGESSSWDDVRRSLPDEPAVAKRASA